MADSKQPGRPRGDGKCPRCKERDREPGMGYCKPCDRAYRRGRRRKKAGYSHEDRVAMEAAYWAGKHAKDAETSTDPEPDWMYLKLKDMSDDQYKEWIAAGHPDTFAMQEDPDPMPYIPPMD